MVRKNDHSGRRLADSETLALGTLLMCFHPQLRQKARNVEVGDEIMWNSMNSLGTNSHLTKENTANVIVTHMLKESPTVSQQEYNRHTCKIALSACASWRPEQLNNSLLCEPRIVFELRLADVVQIRASQRIRCVVQNGA